MVKKNPQYDPQFKINAPRVSVYARQTLNSKSSVAQKFNAKHWSPKQQQFYLKFVETNISKFSDPKKWKIFSIMAKQIKTRSSKQCKSHHAKMILKSNKSIKTLIQTQSIGQITSLSRLYKSQPTKSQKIVASIQQDRQISSINQGSESNLFEDSNKVSFQQENIFDVLSF